MADGGGEPTGDEDQRQPPQDLRAAHPDRFRSMLGKGFPAADPPEDADHQPKERHERAMRIGIRGPERCHKKAARHQENFGDFDQIGNWGLIHRDELMTGRRSTDCAS